MKSLNSHIHNERRVNFVRSSSREYFTMLERVMKWPWMLSSMGYLLLWRECTRSAFLRYVPAEAVIHTGGVEFGITKGVKSSPADLFLFLLNSNQQGLGVIIGWIFVSWRWEWYFEWSGRMRWYSKEHRKWRQFSSLWQTLICES